MKECVIVKEAPYGTVLVKTGTHSFSTKLVESGLISRHDIAVAEQHSLREQLHVLGESLRSERPDVESSDTNGSGDAVSTVIELCDHLIGRAVEVGASDVHVESSNGGPLVRYRICGVLEPVLTLPASVSQPV